MSAAGSSDRVSVTKKGGKGMNEMNHRENPADRSRTGSDPDIFGTHWWGVDHDDELLGLLGKCGHFLYHRPDKSRGQTKILKILAVRNEMTQRELQNDLKVRPASLSEILAKLEAHKMVVRSRDVGDKRKRTVRITETGRAAVRFQSDAEENVNLFDVLTEEEEVTLKRLLEKLVRHWYAQD